MASVTKRPDSKFWIACFTSSDGRQLKRSTKTTDKKDALRIAMDFEQAALGSMTVRQAQAVLGDLMAAADRALPAVTIRQWTERWVARRKREVSAGTFRAYRIALNVWLRWLGAKADGPLASISVQTLTDYREHLALKRLRTTSINDRLSLIGTLLRTAYRERQIPENPADFLNPLRSTKKELDQRGRRAFTLKEVKALLQVSDPEWKSMIIFGLYTGQRLGDLSTLKWENVDLAGKAIRLRTQKTGRFQNLPMAPALYEHAMKWDEFRRDMGSQIPEKYRAFVHPRSASIAFTSDLSRQFSKIMINAGLRKPVKGATEEGSRQVYELSFHSLRYTATSLMKEAGVPASVVMDFIGHTSEAISRIYTHTGEEAMRRAAESMPSLE